MKQELKNALKIIKAEKDDVITKRYALVNSFKTKINRLIDKTPTGELRNELSELNILHETILINYELSDKIST